MTPDAAVPNSAHTWRLLGLAGVGVRNSPRRRFSVANPSTSTGIPIRRYGRREPTGSNAADAYSYDAATGRMTQYAFTVGTATNTGGLTWNANGSLGSLALSQDINPSGPSTTCSYGHDDLGRISSVTCPGVWAQTFTLDPFGNVREDATTGTSFSADFNLANQITSVGSVPGVYDSNGNLVNDPTQNTNSVNSFDSENKAITLEGINVLYDALGRVAETAEPSGSEEFLYGPGGGKLAIMAGQTLARADIPLPGGAEAVYEAGGLTAFRHADQLGSAPLASTLTNTVWSAVGYAPYAEPFPSTGSDRSFTGKKADINGDQYDFPMREYNPTQGRWWTPDPAGAAAVDPSDPQSFNRYAYVNGQPLGLIDPFGLSPIGVCPVAERGDVGPRTSVNAVSGPYEPDDSEEGGAPTDGSCVKIPTDPFAILTIDGVTVDSGLASELELGGPGGTGAALDLDASTSCRTIDCTPTIPGHDGNPQQMGGQWIPPYCAEVGKDGTCLQSKGAYWQWGAETSPALVLLDSINTSSSVNASASLARSTAPTHGSCAAASAELGVGLVTTAAAGAAVVFLGPEVLAPLSELEEGAGLVEGYEAFEASGHGLIGLSEAAIAPVLILGHGAYSVWKNCW